jgi:hypothetical protein
MHSTLPRVHEDPSLLEFVVNVLKLEKHKQEKEKMQLMKTDNG